METKYIPGDLVMTKTKPNNQRPSGLVCKFVAYNLSRKNMILVKTVKSGEVLWMEDEDIVPILLTAKVLEKNFERDKENPCIYIDGKWHELSIHTPTDKGCAIGWEKQFVMFIKYVHELQHLLFGLGLNSELKL